MVAKNIEGRQKAFDAIEKLIADGEPIRFLELSKKIGVPPTTIKRVFNEFFKDKGIKGRARGSGKIIDEIIASGVTDKDQIKKIAKDKYKVNIEDTNIIKKLNIAKDATVEQYVEDIRKMVEDPNYVSKYIKPAKEVGEPANLRAAKAIVANETENFKLKYDRNIANTKRKKREADPIKREEDLVKKAERKAKRRAGKKDVATTPRENQINLNQRAYTRALNKPIKDNPLLVLNDKDLMERLSITVSKDGNIIKIPTGLTKKYLKNRGLFEVEHQRDIFKEGRGKNLPYNRNLIAGPYNRKGGFKEMAEKFIEKNPDPSNPKVQNILKVAENLKITIRPDVPAGTFATKALGYKQIADPIEKFKDVGEKFVSENFLENFIAKVKSVPGGCRAVVTRALGGPIDACEAIIKADPKAAAVKLNNTITATKGPLKELKDDSKKLANLIDTGQVTTADQLPRPDDAKLADTFKETNLRWNNDVGAFETTNGDIASQSDIKKYAADNPMEVKVGEEPVKVATNKSVLKNVGKAIATVGAPLPTALLDAYFINEQVKEGKGTAEIASNPLNWLGLATMEPLSKVAGVAETGKLNSLLRLGLNPATIRGISRFAGLPGLAISTALTAYDQYNKYKDGEGLIYNLFNKEGN